MSGRRTAVMALLAVALAHPGHVAAAWVVDARGECVHEWDAGDLLRGPTAIANAPLLPVRQAIGGFEAARADTSPGSIQRTILLPPLLTLGGGAMGLGEGVIWAATGIADTLTGGTLTIAPAEATQLSVTPMTPRLGTGARTPAPDPCARPTAAR